MFLLKCFDLFFMLRLSLMRVVGQNLELLSSLIKFFVDLLKVSIFGRILGLVLTKFFLRQLKLLLNKSIQFAVLGIFSKFLLFPATARHLNFFTLAL